MSESPLSTESPPAAQSFLVKAQYIKDLSFENPRAPSTLSNPGKPTIEMGVDLKAQKLGDDLFETTLLLSARAISENATLFLIELSYAGLFHISGVPGEKLEPLLLVDCPFMLFPFARQIMANVSRDGGFPPLMLDPIDFFQLYQQNRAAATNAA